MIRVQRFSSNDAMAACRTAVAVVAGILLLPCAGAASPWPASARQTAAALVARMDFASLINLTAAEQMSPYQGTIPAQPRFGIPHIGSAWCPVARSRALAHPPRSLRAHPFRALRPSDHDGPQGVAGGFRLVTAFPSAASIAQTWDPALALAFGAANGLEHKIKGANVLLGPGVNLARIPWCGRNFEVRAGATTPARGVAATALVCVCVCRDLRARAHFLSSRR